MNLCARIIVKKMGWVSVMKVKLIVGFCIMVLGGISLSSCGQRGPLYLPDNSRTVKDTASPQHTDEIPPNH